VIGDMAGFAAACYQRGVHFIQIPTTLLAQVDASIGGKTGVNHPLGKNMIGAFYQPRAVIIDIETLSTLADREYRAGLAEVIKYALLADKDFFAWLQANIDKLLIKDQNALQYAIERSCGLKAQIVAADEKESGQRALLNLGHTFGHAIESITHYKEFLHGEAVAIGMYVAALLSYQLGNISEDEFTAVKKLMIAAQLPYQIPQNITVQQMIDVMSRDKKVQAGKLRFVLLKKVGQAFVSSDVPQPLLLKVLEEAR
ncbi:MAG: 3-dehydroquinate synthase, partial [Gammaproteobacteria bacterium]